MGSQRKQSRRGLSREGFGSNKKGAVVKIIAMVPFVFFQRPNGRRVTGTLPVDVTSLPIFEALGALGLQVGVEAIPGNELSITIFSDDEEVDVDISIVDNRPEAMAQGIADLMNSGTWRTRLPAIADIAEINRKTFEAAAGVAVEIDFACEKCRGFRLIVRATSIGFEATVKVDVPFSLSASWVTLEKAQEAATVAAGTFVNDLAGLKKQRAERN